MLVIRVAGFAGGVNRQRIAQVAHIRNHSHGWQIGDGVILTDICPGRGVDDVVSSAGGEGAAVEQ